MPARVTPVDQPPTAAKGVLLDGREFLGASGPVVKDLVATALAEEEKHNPGAGLDIRPLYALPYGTTWTHRPGVAAIGDAAHLMLPNGEGVNQAMLDAHRLAQAVGTAWEAAAGDGRFGQVLAPLVQAFEGDMAARALRVGEDTEQFLGMMLGPDAANVMARFFLEQKGQ